MATLVGGRSLAKATIDQIFAESRIVTDARHVAAVSRATRDGNLHAASGLSDEFIDDELLVVLAAPWK